MTSIERGRRWLLLAALSATVVSGAWVAQARALNATPDSGEVVNGSVYAVARTPTTIYLGGDFSDVGPLTGAWSAISASNGSLEPAWPKVSGGQAQVNATVSDGSGGFYIGGSFTEVGGVPRNNVAHVLANMTVDPNWNPNAGGGSAGVDALALSPNGSTVYVGGSFSTIGGQPRADIAALSASTGAATSWNPGADGVVDALALSADGSTVYAGGQFAHIAGTAHAYVDALEASTGSANPNWTMDSVGANLPVYALAVAGDVVYVGGEFTTINLNLHSDLAQVLASNGTATAWTSNANGTVYALAVSANGEFLTAGGAFTSLGGATANYLGQVFGSGTGEDGLPTGFDADANGTVYALTPSADGSSIYVGGAFSSIFGLARSDLAQIATSGAPLGWNPNANGHVYALAVSSDSSTVAAGGSFDSIGGQTRNNIAAVDAATGAVTSWNPSADSFVYALALSPDDSTVYAGGQFTSVGGQTRNSIAALNATTGAATSWNPNGNIDVRSLALSGDGQTVYAGGDFTSIGGQTRHRIAALDATTGAATSWNPSADDTVNSLAVSGSTIFAGGFFASPDGTTPSIGGQPRDGIAALDATTGAATSWNPAGNASSPPQVYAVALSPDGSTVYVGGGFLSIGNSPERNNIAAVDASTGGVTSWNPNSDATVFALAVYGSDVFAVGNFESIGGQPRPAGLAELDATTADATSWDPTGVEGGTALASDGGGGVDVGTVGLAVFSAAPTNGSAPQITGMAQAGQQLSCSQGMWNGSPPISYGYQWNRDGTGITSATNATYMTTADDAGHAITCPVTATNQGGNAMATSAALMVQSAGGGGGGFLTLLVANSTASLGTFVPGVAQTYTTSTVATVTSTAASATLSVADPSSFDTGYLVNGGYSLRQPLLADAADASHPAGPYAPVGSSATPTTLLSRSAPVADDPVTVGLEQVIAATDPLRTGPYDKTLTLTLSTTAP